MDLPLTVSVEREIDGLEMGVLSDGTPYFNGRTLAKVCGVAPSAVINQAANWAAGKRDGKLAQKLVAAGISTPLIYTPTSHGDRVIHAYTEQVCMVFMDYYAFDVSPPSPQAVQSFRKLAAAGLRLFIYRALGYDPSNAVPAKWRHFHDRVALASAPFGYFSVFKEISDFVVGAIQAGLPVDERTVPDISVGKAWSDYWRENGLSDQYGERQRHPHNYPDYFPQAASNPQEIWVYPVDAIGEFRRWMQRAYIPEKLPSYLDSKVAKGLLPASTAEILIANVTAPELGPGGP